MYLIDRRAVTEPNFVQLVQAGLVSLVPTGETVLALPIWRKGRESGDTLSSFGTRVSRHEWISLYGDTISIHAEYRILTISVNGSAVWQKDGDFVHAAALFLDYLNSSKPALSWGFTTEQYQRMRWLVYESGMMMGGLIVDLPSDNPSFLVIARDMPSRLASLDWYDFPIARDCYIRTNRITVHTGLSLYPVRVDGEIVSDINKLRAMFD